MSKQKHVFKRRAHKDALWGKASARYRRIADALTLACLSQRGMPMSVVTSGQQGALRRAWRGERTVSFR